MDVLLERLQTKARGGVAAGAEGQSGVQDELDAPVLLRLLPLGHDEQPLADLHGLVELLPVILPVRVFDIFHAEDQRRVLGMLLFEGRQTDTELREGVVALGAVLQIKRDAALAVHLLHQLVVDIVPVLVVIFEEVLEVALLVDHQAVDAVLAQKLRRGFDARGLRVKV